MGTSKKISEYEVARTKWRPVSRLRLRMCLECCTPFPSAGPESRFCPKCTRRLDDMRARMYAESPVRALLDELEDTFDADMVVRGKTNIRLDNVARAKRQRNLCS